jgi:membrane associated rhomboid family serine protease
MLRPKPWQQNFSFGGRLPWAVGLLIAITVVLSLLTAFGDRHAGGLFDLVCLRPADVWRGQLWRLVTWPFVEPSPLGLVFTCLALYWFGAPLAEQWGSRRFLLLVASAMLVAGGGTCLIALVDAEVLARTYLGGWAMITALVLAWGLWFPDRVIRIYFVIPIRGYWVARLTVIVTVVFAVYSGWAGYLPELLAEASVLAWLFRRSILGRWSNLRRSFDARRREGKPAKGARPERGIVVELRPGEPSDPDERGPN